MWGNVGAAGLTASYLFGRGEVAKRLCSSLQIDIEKARLVLGWNPPLGLDQGLKKAIKNLAP